MSSNRNVGKSGENEAIKYLINKNYSILDKNYRTKLGEIDIIAAKEDLVVFVEVKTRKNSNYGYPYESITKIKKDRIIRTAQLYVKHNKLVDYQYRFDVIEIFTNDNNRINHIEDAFWT